jgi:hypothetical protein
MSHFCIWFCLQIRDLPFELQLFFWWTIQIWGFSPKFLSKPMFNRWIIEVNVLYVPSFSIANCEFPITFHIIPILQSYIIIYIYVYYMNINIYI